MLMNNRVSNQQNTNKTNKSVDKKNYSYDIQFYSNKK